MNTKVEPDLKDKVTVDILADGSNHGLAHVHERASIPADDWNGDETNGASKGADESSSTNSQGSAEEEHVVVEIRVEKPKAPKSKTKVLFEESFYTTPTALWPRIYLRKMRVIALPPAQNLLRGMHAVDKCVDLSAPCVELRDLWFLQGGLDSALPVPAKIDLLWSWMGSFLGDPSFT